MATNTQNSRSPVWITRLIGSPGYVMLLMAWTGLLGLVAVVIAPYFLPAGSDAIVVPSAQPVAPASAGNGLGVLVLQILMVVIVIGILAFFTLHTARSMLWLQAKLGLNDQTMWLVKLVLLSIGWLVLAPVLSSLVAVSSVFGTITAALMIAFGGVSFSIELLLLNLFKRSLKTVWGKNH